MAKRQDDVHILRTPESPQRARTRDPDYVESILLCMGTSFIDALDILCDANNRSRRELVEILINYAYIEFQKNPHTRITPP